MEVGIDRPGHDRSTTHFKDPNVVLRSVLPELGALSQPGDPAVLHDNR